MFKCWYEPQASIEPVNDCHQMTFLTTRSTARILFRYLCHRRGLPLRCPAVLLGEGRPNTRERQKSNLGLNPLSLKLLRLISLQCHHLKAINNILMPTLSQYVNLVYLIRSYDSLYCYTKKLFECSTQVVATDIVILHYLYWNILYKHFPSSYHSPPVVNQNSTDLLPGTLLKAFTK